MKALRWTQLRIAMPPCTNPGKPGVRTVLRGCRHGLQHRFGSRPIVMSQQIQADRLLRLPVPRDLCDPPSNPVLFRVRAAPVTSAATDFACGGERNLDAFILMRDAQSIEFSVPPPQAIVFES